MKAGSKNSNRIRRHFGVDISLDGERSMEPIYSQTGGCCIGRNAWLAINATWPFAGLFVCTDQLVLSTFLRRLRFHREDISQIERYYSIFSSGLRIVHKVASYPRHVVFGPAMSQNSKKFYARTLSPLAHKPSNQPVELTASRRVTQFHMSSKPQPAATRALARGSSFLSR